ncbi:MAG TPA: DUF1206 domain-containing protein [Gemmatimonadales bacterium]|nr:DUF1206 domain-containing protein [Gemmatimonadales bacterium]
MLKATNSPGAKEVAPWIERLARVGYAAKAVLYLTVGLLAAQAGLGHGGRTRDTYGALRVMSGVTLGRVILLVIATGLTGYALWRLVDAIADPERRGIDFKGIALRTGSLARAVFHGGLAIAALRLASGDFSGAGGGHPRDWAARALGMPGGDLLVWLGAASVAGYGLYQIYRAYVPKLGRHLDLSSLSAGTAKWVVAVSRFGLAARGLILCLIGLFFARAAAQQDAAQAGGVRESLGTLASMGRWIFVAVALGLAAYGVYELVNARYRRIHIE